MTGTLSAIESYSGARLATLFRLIGSTIPAEDEMLLVVTLPNFTPHSHPSVRRSLPRNHGLFAPYTLLRWNIAEQSTYVCMIVLYVDVAKGVMQLNYICLKFSGGPAGCGWVIYEMNGDGADSSVSCYCYC